MPPPSPPSSPRRPLHPFRATTAHHHNSIPHCQVHTSTARPQHPPWSFTARQSRTLNANIVRINGVMNFTPLHSIHRCSPISPHTLCATLSVHAPLAFQCSVGVGSRSWSRCSDEPHTKYHASGNRNNLRETTVNQDLRAPNVSLSCLSPRPRSASPASAQ